MTVFLTLLVAGVVTGCVYGAFSLLICLIHRVSGIVMLALGEFAMLGAIGPSWVEKNMGLGRVPSTLVVVVVCAAIALCFDTLFFRRARLGTSGFLFPFLLTFGLSMALQGGGQRLFGSDVHGMPEMLSGRPFVLAGVRVDRQAVLIIAFTLLVSGVIAWWLSATMSGRAAEACAQSQIGCEVVGIRHARYRRGALVASGGICAGLGALLVPYTAFTYSSGFSVALTGLVAATAAGLNSPFRGLVFGIALGIAISLVGGYLTASYAEVVVYLAAGTLIAARPDLFKLTGQLRGATT